jgi:acyl homoserine lactone synthase
LVWTRHTSSGSAERLADLRLESNRFFAQITIRAPAQLRSGIMKLIAIQAPTSSKDAALLGQIYHLRARVVADRLAWNVSRSNGRERDQFDEIEPTYILALSDRGY